uniref:3-ketoacyl-CoA thiolase, mitochondrial (inferred by orthology to a human protein) n=1 Tax=Strongyloides venezuelensis TaxID=75913 RepID=A0A0K0G3S8_STRVS
MATKGIFIVGAKRTPFGKFGGALKNITATELQTIVNKSVLESSGIDPKNVDHVVIGNVVHSSKCAAYLARHSSLLSNIPETKPAVIVNRLCGSGFQSAITGSLQIISGDSSVVLVGGVENMSQFPHVVRDIRFGTTFGKPVELEDVIWSSSNDSYAKLSMALTAEKLGKKYGLKREEVDQYAAKSQERYASARKLGVFKKEITPVNIKSKKGNVSFEVDEHPRETSYEQLSKLPPVFQKNGLVTAGNASGICDGAGALLIASEESVKSLNCKPLSRVVGWSVVGCDPTIMGIGPVPAIKNVLKKTGLSMNDISLFEINEAFAAQVVSVQKELNIDINQLNVNGGAIALGHPLGASGSRILGHLSYEMERRKIKYSIGAACIGGGQGIAVLLENTSC